MAVNKVIYGDRTLVDLTQDSVNEDNLLEGETAHDASGNPVTGTAKQGHIVQDNNGTDMPQEENLQFVGVYAEDDPTNDRTKVNIVRPMTKAQMDALTPAQKKGFIRTTDEPDNPYNKSYTLLWENPNPSVAFTNQTISLASNDYDFLIVCAKWIFSATTLKSIIVPKGDSLDIEFAIPRTDGALVARRYATMSNNAITFSEGTTATGTTASATNNNVCIPVKIYGLKF